MPRIRSANKMAVHAVLLFMLAWRRGLTMFLEQPASSLLGSFTPMQEFLQFAMPWQITTSLGAFEAETEKMIKLWSSSKRVAALKRKRKSTGKTLAIKDENGITGKSKSLKLSQAYPTAFGHAVAEVMQAVIGKADINALHEDDVADLIIQHGKAKRAKTR